MQVSGLSGAGSSVEYAQFGARLSRTTDLEVVTAEGDRVTISTASVRSVGYAGVSGTSGETRVAASALQASGSDSVTISVEGDLSKAEIVDLQKVIKAFQQAAARGDASRLLQRLSRPDLDTIASVEGSANTEVTTVATVATATTTAAEPAAPPSGPTPLQPPSAEPPPPPPAEPPPPPPEHSRRHDSRSHGSRRTTRGRTTRGRTTRGRMTRGHTRRGR